MDIERLQDKCDVAFEKFESRTEFINTPEKFQRKKAFLAGALFGADLIINETQKGFSDV